MKIVVICVEEFQFWMMLLYLC